MPPIDESIVAPPPKRHSYQVINSKFVGPKMSTCLMNLDIDLLRVIKKGPAVKNAVDDAIDQCSVVFNLRDSIEEARTRAEEATDEQQKRMHAAKGTLLHPNTRV